MKKLIILALVATTMFVSGCSCTKKEEDPNNNKPNEDNNENTTVITDENAVGEKNVDGIVFENTAFQVTNGTTTIMTKITNTTPNDFFVNNYQLIVTDSEGQVITILTNTIQETFAPNESKTISTPIGIDVSAATNVEYRVNVAEE